MATLSEGESAVGQAGLPGLGCGLPLQAAWGYVAMGVLGHCLQNRRVRVSRTWRQADWAEAWAVSWQG